MGTRSKHQIGYFYSRSKYLGNNITSKGINFRFLRKRDTFACLPTGYSKTLIFQLAVRVAAEFSFEARKSNEYKPNYRQYHFRKIKGISFIRTFGVIFLCLPL